MAAGGFGITLRSVADVAGLAAALADEDATWMDVAGDIADVPTMRLPPGRHLTSSSGAKLTFAPGVDGVELTADNLVSGLSLSVDPDRRAIFNDPSVASMGFLELSELTITGCLRIIAEGSIRSGRLLARRIHIASADARDFSERPAGYGVEVIPGALTVWNRNPDPDVMISADLVGVSVGRPGHPVRGGGVFVAGAGNGGGRLAVGRLETGEIHSDGGIAAGTPDRISAGVFTSSGAFVEVVRNLGTVTTYGANDMVLDNWGFVTAWTAEAAVTSHGPSGIGFVNFGDIGSLRVLAPIETHGLGARGLNVYAGTIEDIELERVVTHADGAVGLQISRPVGRIVVRQGIQTSGSFGDSLVKGVVMRLPATALSVKPGGSARSIEVSGGVIANGTGVAPIEMHGSVNSLSIMGRVGADGGGFEGI